MHQLVWISRASTVAARYLCRNCNFSSAAGDSLTCAFFPSPTQPGSGSHSSPPPQAHKRSYRAIDFGRNSNEIIARRFAVGHGTQPTRAALLKGVSRQANRIHRLLTSRLGVVVLVMFLHGKDSDRDCGFMVADCGLRNNHPIVTHSGLCAALCMVSDINCFLQGSAMLETT